MVVVGAGFKPALFLRDFSVNFVSLLFYSVCSPLARTWKG